MLEIAICDDEPQEIETANRNIQSYLSSHPELNADISVFTSAMELLYQMEKKVNFDILLLDICMPGILGIEAAQQLRKDGNGSRIIFLTTSREYAVEAFSVNAVHYLLKPYSASDFSEAMDKAVRMTEKSSEQHLSVKSRSSVYMLKLKTLLYVEAINHSQFVYSAAEAPVELRMTINELHEMLSETDYDFYRVGAAYIVNLKQIRQLSAKEMVMNGGRHLPVPRGAFAELKKAHMRALFKEVGN